MISATARTYRNAYAGLSRETWLLSFIMLINRSGTMVVPFMTLYLTSKEMGYSVGEAGYVFGLFGAGAFTGAWLGGRLTDRIGFYPVQLFTLFTGGLLFLVLGQMKTYPLICLFTFLLSFVNEAFRPANSTAIAFYSKTENRTRSYALNRLAINLGWAVGSGLGGILASINYELLFWVDGFTNITAALIMWLLLKPADYKPVAQSPAEKADTLPASKDKLFMLFIGATVLFASCFFQLFTNLPVYFERELHLSKPTIGLLMAFNGILIAVIEMVLIYRLEGKRPVMFYITRGILLVGLSFLLLNLSGIGFMLALIMIITVTFGEILSMPFMNSYWITRTQVSNRGQYAALYTMAWSAAQTLGPMGGAQVVQYSNFQVLWYITGGLCFAAAGIFHLLNKKERKKLSGL
ncbi:MAG TPA: MFS transporter [Chitinophagaceae bacterium]|jgi:predicted MFS family arabinose efflux permease|nr:MFS transporter [Chitinophagaceae bacterium]HPH31643.1 MFS transporter [Chitinophagaceae bacterium]HPN58394.1 MFS transporter [Chitinophagaceae bacterium]